MQWSIPGRQDIQNCFLLCQSLGTTHQRPHLQPWEVANSWEVLLHRQVHGSQSIQPLLLCNANHWFGVHSSLEACKGNPHFCLYDLQLRGNENKPFFLFLFFFSTKSANAVRFFYYMVHYLCSICDFSVISRLSNVYFTFLYFVKIKTDRCQRIITFLLNRKKLSTSRKKIWMWKIIVTFT